MDCISRVICAMEFSLGNPGFSASAKLAPEVSQDSSVPLPPTACGSSSSAPSSWDSAHCKCRRRMSKTVFDCHTVCFKCHGYDCFIDKRCDECLDWSQEEMEAYVEHRRSRLSKDRGWKDSLPKPPSSLGLIQPPSTSMTFSLSDVDDRITGHISALSDAFDRKLDALTCVLLDKFSSNASLDQANMSARLPNCSVSAPPEVPVPGPSHG